MNIVYESELCHHGIKRQKWGVRRYQNEDGSYTEAGKKHYGVKRFRHPGGQYTNAAIFDYGAKQGKRMKATDKAMEKANKKIRTIEGKLDAKHKASDYFDRNVAIASRSIIHSKEEIKYLMSTPYKELMHLFPEDDWHDLKLANSHSKKPLSEKDLADGVIEGHVNWHKNHIKEQREIIKEIVKLQDTIEDIPLSEIHTGNDILEVIDKAATGPYFTSRHNWYEPNKKKG